MQFLKALGLTLLGLVIAAFAAGLFLLGFSPEPAPSAPPEAVLAEAKAILADPRWAPPQGWSFGEFARPDGTKLRFGHAPALGVAGARANAPIFVYVPGFTNLIEQGYEFLSDLQKRGVEVYSIDLRGQGGSSRALPGQADREKSYVPDFKTYADDLAAFLAEEPSLKGRGPVVLGGLSLGGHAVLRTAIETPRAAAAYVLISPAIGIHTAPLSPPDALTLADFMTTIGAGRHYAPGQGPRRWSAERLKGEHGCGGDHARAAMVEAWNVVQPETRMGGGSFAWLKGFLRSNAIERDKTKLARVTAPVLLINPQKDQTVIPAFNTQSCRAMGACVELDLAESHHCPFVEPDAIRNIALDRLSQFLLQQSVK